MEKNCALIALDEFEVYERRVNGGKLTFQSEQYFVECCSDSHAMETFKKKESYSFFYAFRFLTKLGHFS